MKVSLSGQIFNALSACQLRNLHTKDTKDRKNVYVVRQNDIEQIKSTIVNIFISTFLFSIYLLTIWINLTYIFINRRHPY